MSQAIPSPVARARRLLDEADDGDPARILRLGRGLLATAERTGDRAAAALASRALGVASLNRGDLHRAERHFRGAVAVGRDAVGTAEARRGLARALAELGRCDEARRELDAARPHLRGAAATRLVIVEALVAELSGQFDHALVRYRRALTRARGAGDPLLVARAYGNRGLLHQLRGDLPSAERDLARAEAIFSAAGRDVHTVKARHNIALLRGSQGRVPEALALLDAVAADLARLDIPGDHAAVLRDRCELLLSVGLVADAVEAGRAAVPALRSVGARAEAAEASLVLAECHLAAEHWQEAQAAARGARAMFARQRRPGWAAVARLAVIRARFGAGVRDPTLLRAARAARRELEATGLPVPATRAALLAGRVALALKRPGVAAAELTIASRGRRRSHPAARLDGWLAEGFRRLAAGRTASCLSALRAGLRVLDEQRALLGASELRSASGGGGEAHTRLGLRLALELGRPDVVLEWAEAAQARSLSFPRALPPDDPQLAATLAALRDVSVALETAVLQGRHPRDLSDRRAQIERDIRTCAMRRTGSEAEQVEPVRAGSLREALDGRALVEIAESDGRLHAVVLTADRFVLRDLGAIAPVRSDATLLAAALRRLAVSAPAPGRSQAALATARALAERLGTCLIGPIVGDIGDRDVVIVPGASLQTLPWNLLPPLEGRPVTVAPSAGLWGRATRRPVTGAGSSCLVAGPGLVDAQREVEAIATSRVGATALVGSAATAASVLAAIDGRDVVHVAAHGAFRSDNPLFSSLALSDGPLTVYDLERVATVPTLFVLSVCDSGRAELRRGGEFVGLSAVLLAMGARTVVASNSLVPDALSLPLMADLHARLVKGETPAAALAHAVAALDVDAEQAGRAMALRGGLVCLGAG